MSTNRRRPVAIAAAGLLAVLLVCAPSAGAQVSSGPLRANLTPDPWRLSLTDAAGSSILQEHTGLGSGPSGTLGFRTAGGWFHATRVLNGGQAGAAFEGNLETTDPTRGIHVRLAPDGEGLIRLTASVTGNAADVTAIGIGFEARPDERYLGFGERSNAVDQRGNEVENYVSDGPYEAEDRPIIQGFVPPVGYRDRDDATYFPMPWLLSTAGYGVLMHNTETSYYRLGSSEPGAWSLEAEATSLELTFVAGPSPAEVLRRLTAITGRQPPPVGPWVFGPWYQPTGSDRLGQARALRGGDVPGSAVNTYLHYLPCGDQQGVEAQQPTTTAGFHGEGYAITTYFNPMICTDYSPAYGQAAAADVLTEDSMGQPYVYPYNSGVDDFDVAQFDFSAPGAVGFYGNLLAEAVGHGYDGWMEDFGEYTPLDSQSANGMDGTRMHNLYPKLYHCASWEFARARSMQPAAFIRSGWTGVHPCAQIVWGGDPSVAWGFDGLDGAIKQALTLGTSGISRWGSDIGGFFRIGGPQLSPELLSRWIELGAVSGVMRTEANGVNVGVGTRPQIFDADILPTWRRYAKLRTQLYPYLRAADSEYLRTGMPIMRHLALTDPDDATAVGRDDEFMFGEELLAAPVREPGATTRELYLPAGRWIDFWRAVRYRSNPGSLELKKAKLMQGGRTATIPAPLEELPLAVRAGAVLALLPSTVDTLAPYGGGETVRLDEIGKRLHLLAFPRGKSSSAFGERGYLGSRERKGRWRLTISGAKKHRIALEVSLTTMKRDLDPCRVLIDGKVLKKQKWSTRKGVLEASFKTRKDVSRLTVHDESRCD